MVKNLQGLVLMGLLFSMAQASAASIDLQFAPPAKMVDSRLVVPMDIQKIKTRAEYDEASKKAQSTSEVFFTLQEEGFPFLLLKKTSQVFVDGVLVKILALPEPYQSNMFAIDKKMSVGEHKITVLNSYTPDPKNATFISVRYYDGSFIEDLIPCNTLNDHFELNLEFKILSVKPYELITNAEKMEMPKQNNFVLKFPAHFTSSSFQIDLARSEDLIKSETVLKSIDGRSIPVLVYSTVDDRGQHLIPSFMNKTIKALPLLEAHLGVYPFSQIILKSTRKLYEGAYAGAMVLREEYNTNDLVVHELGHSWYLKSIQPVNGSDIWLHEGMGNWARSYPTATQEFAPDFQKIVINQDLYAQVQKYNAHEAGSTILAALDFKLQAQGGVWPFLRAIFLDYKDQTLSTSQFFVELEKRSQVNMDSFVKYYFEGVR